MKSDFMDSKNFRLLLQNKMDESVNFIYSITKKFPIDERFGVISQLRRASLSVILNFIEGFARNNVKVYKNFLKISYASLKETKYLINFSYKQNYINLEEYNKIRNDLEEISKMLWTLIKK